MSEDKSRMVLRYHIPLENHKERFKSLVYFLKRTGIRRVILFTGAFVEESAFFPMEYYEKHSEVLSGYMPVLKTLGVETGINVLNTMGHVYYSRDGEFDIQRAYDMDGNPSKGWACLMDEKLHGYVKKQYELYAALKPDTIFLDDDVRYVKLNNLSCFCDEHLKKFSTRLGEDLSREQIKSRILSNSTGVNITRQAVMDILKEDIDKLTFMIQKTIHGISPETRVGIMTGELPSVTFDRDLREFFIKSVPKKVDMIRTGMNFYREGEVKEIPLAFANPMIQRNLINHPNVEIQPEIENDTYTMFYKSKAVTHLQTVWCLTNGLRNMQLNIFEMLDYPINDFEEYTALYAENMKYYNAIADLIPEGTRASGVGIYRNSRSLLYRRVKEEGSINDLLYRNYWYQWIGLDGLPVGYNWDETSWLFLTGDDIVGADKDTIEIYLKKGAVIDVRAAECLAEMGYGDRIGIREINPVDREFAGERFSEDPMNGRFAGFHNSYYFHSGLISQGQVKSIDYKEGVREISRIINHHKEKVANGLTLYENESGERFCIIPMDTGLFQQFMNVNYKRKEQLINIFEWIAREPLPVVSLHANVVVNINKLPDKNIITLFNLTTDMIPKIRLKYEDQHKIYCLNKAGEIEEVDINTECDTLEINRSIDPLGCIVLIEYKKVAQ